MTIRHWMRIAALTSALGLTGAAIAQNTRDATSPVDRGGSDTPSSGAIVTPQDKALRMGKDDARAGNSDGAMNDDRSIISPRQSNDEGPNVNPGPSSHEELTSPPRRGPDVGPGDVAPGSVRGQ